MYLFIFLKTAAQCRDIPRLKNGSVTVTGRNDGLTANFACDAGFTLVGNESLSCKSSVWNWDILQCGKNNY